MKVNIDAQIPASKAPVALVAQRTATSTGIPRRHLLQAAISWPLLPLITACDVVRKDQQPGTISLVLLTPEERLFLDAATARLIPDGDDGLGARAAQVPYFIERQLAGDYGQATTWYMQGPFAKGTEQQGYQSEWTPAQLYRIAMRDIDAYCKAQHGGKAFAALSGDEQDQILHGLEKGDIQLAQAPAKQFFDMLWQNTQEGFLADPMYGGNRNFAGWRLIGYPGPRYNYLAEVTQYGQPYKLPTVGLLGRNGTLVQELRL